MNPVRLRNGNRDTPARQPWRQHWVRVLVCLAALTGAAQPGQQTPSGNADKRTPPPDSGPQLMTRAQEASQPNTKAADAGSKNRIAADSALLLQLATDLKTEVDKTDKDTLSLTVIRKADAIEKLAHKVKDTMKPKAGAG